MKKPFKFESTGDLLAALERLGQSGMYATVALVIAVDSKTEFIFADDGDHDSRQQAINDLVKRGGIPAGFLGVTQGRSVTAWPLPNYKDNAKIKAYLEMVERESRMTLLMDEVPVVAAMA